MPDPAHPPEPLAAALPLLERLPPARGAGGQAPRLTRRRPTRPRAAMLDLAHLLALPAAPLPLLAGLPPTRGAGGQALRRLPAGADRTAPDAPPRRHA